MRLVAAGVLVAWLTTPVSAQLPASVSRLKPALEAVLNERRVELATDIGHYGLVFTPTPEMLQAFLDQVEAREHRGGFVVTLRNYFDPARYPARESHGGTFLSALLGFWRPDGRPARLQDRWTFANGARVLDDIYVGHKKQLFIPPNESAPPLPVILLPFESNGKTVVEAADAYQVVLLVIEHTPAERFGETWANIVNQSLSVDRVVDQVRTAYLADRRTGVVSADHTSYHAMEILVKHAQKAATKPDFSEVARRFLEVELSETELLKNEMLRDALVSHYIQSLGYLLSYDRLELSAEQKAQVRAWLGTVVRYFPDSRLEVADVHELAHALHGLRLIEAHADKLE